MDIQQRLQALLPSALGNKVQQALSKEHLESIKMISKDVANSYFGQQGKGNFHVQENAEFEVYGFSPEEAQKIHSSSSGSIAIRDLPTMLLMREGNQSPEDVLKLLKEAISENKIALAIRIKNPKQEKEQLVVPDHHAQAFQNQPIIVHKYDQKSGTVQTATSQPGQFQVTSLTAQQYSRITGSALQSLDKLSETFRAYTEQMKKNEEKGDYPLSDRTITRRSGQGDGLKDFMKGVTASNLAQRRRQDARQKELKNLETEREEKQIEKERRTEKEKKFTKEFHQNTKLDQKKSEHLDNIKKDKTT